MKSKSTSVPLSIHRKFFCLQKEHIQTVAEPNTQCTWREDPSADVPRVWLTLLILGREWFGKIRLGLWWTPWGPFCIPAWLTPTSRVMVPHLPGSSAWLRVITNSTWYWTWNKGSSMSGWNLHGREEMPWTNAWGKNPISNLENVNNIIDMRKPNEEMFVLLTVCGTMSLWKFPVCSMDFAADTEQLRVAETWPSSCGSLPGYRFWSCFAAVADPASETSMVPANVKCLHPLQFSFPQTFSDLRSSDDNYTQTERGGSKW